MFIRKNAGGTTMVKSSYGKFYYPVKEDEVDTHRAEGGLVGVSPADTYVVYFADHPAAEYIVTDIPVNPDYRDEIVANYTETRRSQSLDSFPEVLKAFQQLS